MFKMKTRMLALLLAVLCVVGVLPTGTALAAGSDTITLSDYKYTGLSYTSAALGKSSVHPMTFKHNGSTVTGFCGEHVRS